MCDTPPHAQHSQWGHTAGGDHRAGDTHPPTLPAPLGPFRPSEREDNCTPPRSWCRMGPPRLAHAAARGWGETHATGGCVGTLVAPPAAALGPKGDGGQGGKGQKEGAQAALRREALGRVGDGDGGALAQGAGESWSQGRGTGLLPSPAFPPPSSSPRTCLEQESWRRMTSADDERSPPAARIPQQRCSFPGAPWHR